MPRRASSSARSFIASPAWPLTQRQSISWRAARCVEPAPEVLVLDRLLVGGAPAVALPAVHPVRHAAAQILRSRCAARPRRGASAPPAPMIAAISSMRLLVVSGSPPQSSFSRSPQARIAPQPPGPGLPEQAAVGPDRRRGRSCAAGRSRGALTTRWWKRILARYSSGFFGVDLRARRHVEPVDQPRQHEAQRRAAREDRQRLDLGRRQRPHASRSRRSSPCPWRR